MSDFSLLEDYFSMLYYNETIEKNILNSIIDEYTIADDASKALSALRRNKRKLEQDVRDKLSNFIHSSSYSKYLMDSIITIRNDRFVIPVKEEYKDSKMCIRDSSTTAATATCPAYGSPLASLYTVLASRFKSLLLVLLLELELPLELNIPIASSVLFPAIPSTVNPFFL